jgi:hypothetical protein
MAPVLALRTEPVSGEDTERLAWLLFDRGDVEGRSDPAHVGGDKACGCEHRWRRRAILTVSWVPQARQVVVQGMS